MQTMAEPLRRGRAASDLMKLVAAQDARRGPYNPCPWGSGRKFCFCHGDRPPASPFGGVTRDAQPVSIQSALHARTSAAGESQAAG
jgi:uncharacterized protein